MILQQLKKPVLVFAVIASIFGLIAVFVAPPMAINDEIAHFSRAYEVSNGVFVTKTLASGNLGGNVPHVFTDMDGLVVTDSGLKPKPNPVYLQTEMNKLSSVSINQPQKVELSYSNTALYSPVTYVVQSIAVLIGRVLNLSFFTTFYLTRIFVLISFICLVMLAIRITPIKKWAFVVIALLPMCIQEAASVSSDALIVATCLLFIACFLYVYKAKTFKFSFKNRAISLFPVILLSATYASLAKPVYFPLFLILSLLPLEVFKTKRARIKSLLLLLGIPFVLLVGWNAITVAQDNSDAQKLSLNSVGIYPPTTVDGVKSLLNPAYTAKLLFNTYVDQLPAKQDIPNFITQGFFGKFTAFYISPPAWYMLTVGLPLLLSFFIVDKVFFRFSKKFYLLLFGALLIAWVGITLSMFFIATTAGQAFINGIQGRYFLPLVGFLLLFTAGAKNIISVKDGLATRILLISLVVFNLFFMELLVWQWFHY